MVQTVNVSLCHSFFPIGDNITMLTTADWLLGSNSQSAAGLSTLSDTMKGQYLVFSPTLLRATMRGVFVVHFFWTIHKIQCNLYFFKNQKWTFYELDISKFTSTIVPFIQKLFSIFCNCCGILFQAWFDTTGFRVNECSDCEPAYCGFCFHLNVPCRLLNTVVIVCSVTWVCASLCMHLATIFFIGVLFKRIASRQHMFLRWTSIAETCKTWQQMASSTIRDSTEHDFLAHIVNLFCQKKKKWGEEKTLQPAWSEMDWFQRFLSCQITVKLSLQIYRLAV